MFFIPAVMVARLSFCLVHVSAAEVPRVIKGEGQPIGANAQRLLQALEVLGNPLPAQTHEAAARAAAKRDVVALQEALDPHVLLVVSISPELRVKVARGPAPARLQQGGFTPVLVKILNDGKVSERLNIQSPQGGAVYAGAADNTLTRQQQSELNRNENTQNDSGRFLSVEMFASPPMTERLSGMQVEYALALISSSEAGRREAMIGFNVGPGTQDLGFRGEVPVLFEVAPAINVKLSIHDTDGRPTTARLTFRDGQGRIYPPQAKRLAPDLFFQPQIYRTDGETVLLPPGKFTLTYSRGPEYLDKEKDIVVPPAAPARIEVQLERWVDPMKYGFVSGDHHIHGAGCAHYQVPTEGVTPKDMLAQVKGEALNVGSVLTWGPCFEYQRQFFSPGTSAISEPLTVLKYDLEVSGFGSQALGHVCLLNLKNQTYPGTDGTKTKGWPTWTIPVLRWTKQQGGVTGYPHSDLLVDPPAYAKRYVARHDKNGDDLLDRVEAETGLLPGSFTEMDTDGDRRVNANELGQWADRAANKLPHLVLPAMQGTGAMEIFVGTAEGVVDFISAMNTGRIGEWNTWYHLMNSGFPLKVSGETDFPCMSGTRVGQGRVYVKMGDTPARKVDFQRWVSALAKGRSYVSDGYAHALEFTVKGAAPGTNDVQLAEPGAVQVSAKVAFAPATPKAVAYGTMEAGAAGQRFAGDTRLMHARRSDEKATGGERIVEVVVNGQVAASAVVPADGAAHDLSFNISIERSSWVALRQFPQLHTNPVNVLVAHQPIRASRESALWSAESIDLLWENRSQLISEEERPAAREAYTRAGNLFRTRAREAEEQTALLNNRKAAGNTTPQTSLLHR